MRGAWIEIALSKLREPKLGSRSPCGERGLKYNRETGKLELHLSLPVRGAWIEM